MLEWLKRHAWKACIRQKRIGGSNPPLSARGKEIPSHSSEGEVLGVNNTIGEVPPFGEKEGTFFNYFSLICINILLF